MKLTLTRRALKEAVAGFAKIVASRTALPVLGGVRFEAGRDGAVAEATNLDEHLRFCFPTATALEAGVLIVPLQALKDLCKGDARDTLLLESEGDDTAVSHPVGGHTLRRAVEGIPVADWPAVQGTVPTLAAPGFLTAFRRVAPFASVDASRPVLNTVYADVSGKGPCNATLVATDGHRLTT